MTRKYGLKKSYVRSYSLALPKVRFSTMGTFNQSWGYKGGNLEPICEFFLVVNMMKVLPDILDFKLHKPIDK